MSGPHALALNERTRQLFTDAGLDERDAARAAHVLIVYLLGSLAPEIAHPESQALPLDRQTATERYLWGLHRVLDGLSHPTAA